MDDEIQHIIYVHTHTRALYMDIYFPFIGITLGHKHTLDFDGEETAYLEYRRASDSWLEHGHGGFLHYERKA